MRKFLFGLICTLGITFENHAFAIEPISPNSLCERFLQPSEQKKCRDKIQEYGADSYIAAVCQNQFEDESLFKCLEFSKVSGMDPNSMEKCAAADLNDDARIACLKQVAASAAKSDKRLPAAQKSKKK